MVLKQTKAKPKRRIEDLSSFVGKEGANATLHSNPKKKANCCTFPSKSRINKKPAKSNFLRNCDTLKRKSNLKDKESARKATIVIGRETTKKLVQLATKLRGSWLSPSVNTRVADR